MCRIISWYSKRLARVSTCKIIYIWISLLTTITRNVGNKYETPSHVASAAARWFPFIWRCACCMLTKVHSSRPVDEIISVSHRAGRGAEPMQTSLETPKRANTGAECPKLLTHSLIHESLCPFLPRDLALLLLLFLSSTDFIPDDSRLRLTTAIQWGLLSRRLQKRKQRLLWYANYGNFSVKELAPTVFPLTQSRL